MNNFTIQIPVFDVEKNVEVHVKVNGQTKRVHYRMELFDWTVSSGNHETYIDRLRTIIREYEEGWELFQIGNPSQAKLPIVFRQRS